METGESRNSRLTWNVVGLNVVRMNFSHGSYEYNQSVIDNAREAEKTQAGRPVAIALDTVGFTRQAAQDTKC